MAGASDTKTALRAFCPAIHFASRGRMECLQPPVMNPMPGADQSVALTNLSQTPEKQVFHRFNAREIKLDQAINFP